MFLKKLTYLISLIFIVFCLASCDYSEDDNIYTGMYDAEVTFFYKVNNTVKDTTIKTVLIINQSLNYKNAYDIQWILDNYIKLGDKVVSINNVLPVSVVKKGDENNFLDLILRCDSDVATDFQGFMTGSIVMLNFKCCNMSIAVNAKRFEN